MTTLRKRIEQLRWPDLEAGLESSGHAVAPALLTEAECDDLCGSYGDLARFRKRVVMERQGYGRGEYQYFDRPLPTVVATLRSGLYPYLAPVANRWSAALGREAEFPPTLEEFAALCAAAGQHRPTPLLLRYHAGDFNRLHQDLYGEHVFPMQATILLSRPGTDFTGGEFVLTEGKARMQSRAEVVPLEQGDAVVFAVRDRPGHGRRGVHRLQHRHGVSPIRSGERFALGVIFHDAL